MLHFGIHYLFIHLVNKISTPFSTKVIINIFLHGLRRRTCNVRSCQTKLSNIFQMSLLNEGQKMARIVIIFYHIILKNLSSFHMFVYTIQHNLASPILIWNHTKIIYLNLLYQTPLSKLCHLIILVLNLLWKPPNIKTFKPFSKYQNFPNYTLDTSFDFVDSEFDMLHNPFLFLVHLMYFLTHPKNLNPFHFFQTSILSTFFTLVSLTPQLLILTLLMILK